MSLTAGDYLISGKCCYKTVSLVGARQTRGDAPASYARKCCRLQTWSPDPWFGRILLNGTHFRCLFCSDKSTEDEANMKDYMYTRITKKYYVKSIICIP